MTVVALAMLASFDPGIRTPAASSVYVASFLVLASATACVALVREVTTAQSHRFTPATEPVPAQA